MNHPDDLTGADVFDVPDTSLSPTDPAELVPWLRALPVGSVLLDREGDAWQLREANSKHLRFRCTSGESHYLYDDPSIPEMTDWAPYRLVWTSGGGR